MSKNKKRKIDHKKTYTTPKVKTENVFGCASAECAFAGATTPNCEDNPGRSS